MMKLTKEQLQEMMAMQKSLDEYVIANNEIGEDVNITQGRYIALKTELHEFINEIKFFKYWSKNKKINKEHILEEGIDCVHFILSLMIEFGYDIQEDLEITEKQLEHIQNKTMAELYLMTDTLLVDTFITNAYKENMASALVGIMLMFNRCGFTGDDLYNAYIKKNKVNIERQNNAY